MNVKIRNRYIALVVFFGTIVLLITGVNTHSFWLDDGYSIWISQDFDNLADGLRSRGGNGSLYFTLLWLWRLIADSETGLRLLSIIPAAAAASVSFILLAERVPKVFALLAAASIATNPLSYDLAQNVRPYALLLLLSTINVWMLTRYLAGGSKRYLALFFAIGCAACATHFMALVFFFAIGVWCVVEWLASRDNRFFALGLTVLGVGLFGLALLLVFANGDSQHLEYLRNERLDVLRKFLRSLTGGGVRRRHVIGFLLCGALGAAIVFGVLLANRAKHARLLRLVLAWLLVPLVVMIAVSELGKPIYIDRYLITLVPATGALFAFLAAQRKIKVTASLALLALVGNNVIALHEYLNRQSTEQWRSAANLVANSHAADGTALMFYTIGGQYVFEYYASRTSLGPGALAYPEYWVPTDSADYTDRGQPNAAQVKAIAEEHTSVILISSHILKRLPDRLAAIDVFSESLGSVYRCVESRQFNGLRLDRYSRGGVDGDCARVWDTES